MGLIDFVFDLKKNVKLILLRKKGLTIGAGCWIGANVFFDSNVHLIKIGNNTTIAMGTVILTHDASTMRLVRYTRFGEVHIGSNCFIGANSIILPDVHIGNNCVIGAGSVVTHDIPSNSVACGNPAKILMTTQKYVVNAKLVSPIS